MKQKDTLQKLRGGYSTPYPIAAFLADWAIRSPEDTVLEPSCGEGVVLEAAYRRLSSLKATINRVISQVVGVEIEVDDCEKARQRLESAFLLSEPKSTFSSGNPRQPALAQYLFHQQDFRIINDDFFHFYSQYGDKKFDAVIGNPPFIRYQNWEEKQRELALKIMKRADLKANRLTNAWVAFLVASSFLLKPNGRLAMVIPAELLQVKFAAQLRLFLSEFFNSITVLTFKKLVFPSIQQEVVLLLCEKVARNGHGINVVELDDASSLQKFELDKIRLNLKPIEHTEDKWTLYFLTSEEILLLRELRKYDGLERLGNIAHVDVGIVTGENEFFVVNKSTLTKFNLANYVIPLIGRTAYLKGVVFKASEWDQIQSRGSKCYLLTLPEKPVSHFNFGLLEYLKQGEAKKVHKGYKCRIRKFWYSVPSVWISDAFLTRQINSHPKLVLNEARVAVTDTIHRVKFKEKIDPKTAVVCFHNSLTLAFSEITGRSYGGGVLELEPNEAEQLPIPYCKTKMPLEEADELLRMNKVHETLNMIDSLTLQDKMGLPEKQIRQLRGIWEKLARRRTERKYRA